MLETLNQILTAGGVTITTVALFMYALGFNWRDRIAQTFGLILLSVALIYSSETIAAISEQDHIIQFWLRIKWTGAGDVAGCLFAFLGRGADLDGQTQPRTATQSGLRGVYHQHHHDDFGVVWHHGGRFGDEKKRRCSTLSAIR